MVLPMDLHGNIIPEGVQVMLLAKNDPGIQLRNIYRTFYILSLMKNTRYCVPIEFEAVALIPIDLAFSVSVKTTIVQLRNVTHISNYFKKTHSRRKFDHIRPWPIVRIRLKTLQRFAQDRNDHKAIHLKAPIRVGHYHKRKHYTWFQGDAR